MSEGKFSHFQDVLKIKIHTFHSFARRILDGRWLNFWQIFLATTF